MYTELTMVGDCMADCMDLWQTERLAEWLLADRLTQWKSGCMDVWHGDWQADLSQQAGWQA